MELLVELLVEVVPREEESVFWAWELLGATIVGATIGNSWVRVALRVAVLVEGSAGVRVGVPVTVGGGDSVAVGAEVTVGVTVNVGGGDSVAGREGVNVGAEVTVGVTVPVGGGETVTVAVGVEG